MDSRFPKAVDAWSGGAASIVMRIPLYGTLRPCAAKGAA